MRKKDSSVDEKTNHSSVDPTVHKRRRIRLQTPTMWRNAILVVLLVLILPQVAIGQQTQRQPLDNRTSSQNNPRPFELDLADENQHNQTRRKTTPRETTIAKCSESTATIEQQQNQEQPQQSNPPHRRVNDEQQDSRYYLEQPQYALLYPWIVQALGVIVFFILQHLELPIPYAAIMFLAGMCMGIAAFRLNGNLTHFHNSIRQWSDIDAQVLLLVFLPGLIFRDAIEVNVPTFRQCLSQLVVFAFPMVLMGTILTAVVIVYVLPQEFWDWSLALTVGSILASTDPVAVSAVLKQADAPPRLQMHIGGESMLNDGAAVVFYSLFSQQFLAQLGLPSGNQVSIGKGIATFFQMSLGGVAVGLVFGAGLLVLLYELDRRLDRENNVVQVAAAVSTAYLSYYCSEQVFSMSGVIACVTAGIMTKALGNSLIRDPQLMDNYLTLLEHLLNTLLFTLGGTFFGEVISNSDLRASFTYREWLSLLALYVMVMVIRGIQVVAFYPLIKRIGLSTNWKEMSFFGFSGLRGAVGIALALSLDRTVRQESEDESQRAMTSTVVGLAGGVSFLTLVLNGTLAGWLLRSLQLSPPITRRKRALRMFEVAAREYAIFSFSKLKKDQPRFAGVSFNVIQHHVPFLREVPQEVLDGFEQQSASQFFRLNSRHDSFFGSFNDHSWAQSIHQTVSMGKDLDCSDVQAEIRELFLQKVGASYKAEEEQLDNHDDNDIHLDALRQSVLFAAEDAHASPTNKMHDWETAKVFAHQDDNDNLDMLIDWFQTKILRRTTETPHPLRTGVIRALIFMEAHRRAEKDLRSYLNSAVQEEYNRQNNNNESVSSLGMSTVNLEEAIQHVLQESNAQVEEAQEWLDTMCSPEDVEIIRSHYMANIILHKVARFVEKAVSDGRLKEKEGQQYLNNIDQRVRKCRCCHNSHVEISGGSRRYRRRKQKSTESTDSTYTV